MFTVLTATTGRGAGADSHGPKTAAPLTIGRTQKLTGRAFRRLYLKSRQPVIVPGLVEHWPASRWTFAKLEQRFRGVRVPALATLDGAVVVDPRRGLVTEPIALDALIADVLQPLHQAPRRRAYLMARADQLPARLTAGLSGFAYLAYSPWSVSKLWLGPQGTLSALHYDLSHNLHAQLIGRKRFTLFPPGDRRRLYPQKLLSGVPNASQVDWGAPDLEAFPNVDMAQPWRGELCPGETLFIPKGWWHYVETLEPSLTANTWWADGLDLLVVTAAGIFKRCYGISR